MKLDYENRVQTYRYDGGEFRIGMDGQIVNVKPHETLANSHDAHAWIEQHAAAKDKERAKRATRPPRAVPLSRLENIAGRKSK